MKRIYILNKAQFTRLLRISLVHFGREDIRVTTSKQAFGYGCSVVAEHNVEITSYCTGCNKVYITPQEISIGLEQFHAVLAEILKKARPKIGD